KSSPELKAMSVQIIRNL
ncbi:putative exported protein, partial [Chlamydia psittaci 84-8471/1]